MPFDSEHLRGFRRYLAAAEGLSPLTVSRYMRYAGRWLSFCELKGVDPLRATFEDAMAWVEQDVRADKYSSSTRYQMIWAARRLYDWLMLQGHTSSNPFHLIRTPKVRYRLIPGLSEEEMAKLLALEPVPTPEGIRDWALLRFLYATWLRTKEVRGLDVEDLNLSRGIVVIRPEVAKGGKPGLAYLSPAAKQAMELYLRASRPYMTSLKGGPLWVSNRGTRIGRSTLQRILHRMAKEAGLPNPLTVHGIRRTGAEHMRRRIHDIKVVQELLRHDRLSSTERYLAGQPGEAAEVVARYHPLDALTAQIQAS